MVDSVGGRFSKALEKIFDKKNNKVISEKYKITPQSVGQLKKKKSINEMISFICENENINLNWIQTGKGSMFIEEPISNSKEEHVYSHIEINDIEDIIQMLKYAPSEFLTILKNKLKTFKDLSQL